MAGASPDRWGDLCAEQLQRLCSAGFMPMVSLVVGLPGETPQHVQTTLDWVRSIAELPLTIFPVFLTPVRDGRAVVPADLTRLHWRLIRECYELNFRRVPGMYWNDQLAAGVGLGKRVALQLLGKGQVVLWRCLLSRHMRRASS